MKTIIAGSRDICDKKTLWNVIQGLDFEITEVVSGGAKGMDRAGEDYAKWAGIHIEKFPAQWKNFELPGAVKKTGQYGDYNATAGHFRNEQMAQYADVLILIWDGKSRGSANMFENAEFYGLRIIERVVRAGTGSKKQRRR